MDIIDRQTARSFGLKRFFNGRICSKGHLSERYVASGNCIECVNPGSLIKKTEIVAKDENYIMAEFAFIATKSEADLKLKAAQDEHAATLAEASRKFDLAKERSAEAAKKAQLVALEEARSRNEIEFARRLEAAHIARNLKQQAKEEKERAKLNRTVTLSSMVEICLRIHPENSTIFDKIVVERTQGLCSDLRFNDIVRGGDIINGIRKYKVFYCDMQKFIDVSKNYESLDIIPEINI